MTGLGPILGKSCRDDRRKEVAPMKRLKVAFFFGAFIGIAVVTIERLDGHDRANNKYVNDDEFGEYASHG